MECQICLEQFDNSEKRPIVLECGHTFCKKCMNCLYSKDPVICPLDRKTISKSLDELQVNYSLDELVQSTSLKPPSSVNPILSNTLEEEHKEKPSSSLPKPTEPKIKITQTIQSLCPSRHILIHYINIQSRNRAANKPATLVIICNICRTRNIRSSWSCTACDYDLCEVCLTTVSSQNTLLSNLTTNPNLVCLKNHQLVYYSNIENRNSSAGISFYSIINCNFCETKNIRSSWSCLKCNFDLCRFCSADQMQSDLATNLATQICINSHPLFYYKNTESFYLRKLKNLSVGFFCILCSKKLNGGSWACRSCSFDLCSECINKEIEYIHTKCNNNHDLKKLNHDGVQRNCGICKRLAACLYNCMICNFFSCESCVKYFERAVYLPVTCPLAHGLVDSQDVLGMYQRKYVKKSYSCSGCLAKIKDSRNYHCRICDFDLCAACFCTVDKGSIRGIEKRCDHGHELRWLRNTYVLYKKSYKCGVCRQSYKCGSFHCEICRFDLCVKCSESLTAG